jgi:general secretion pathway protein D
MSESPSPPNAATISTAAAPNSSYEVPFKSEGSPFESDDESLKNPESQPDSFPPSSDAPFQPSGTPATSPAAPSRNSATRPDDFEMPSGASASPSTPPAANPSLIDSAAQGDQALAQQLSAEVGRRQSEALRLLEKEQDPDRAKAILEEAQQLVKDSKLSSGYRRDLLVRLDSTLKKTDKYIADHRAEIELDRANEAVLDSVERDRDLKAKVEQKKAELVEQFNQLRDEQRYGEMEIVARRLIELAPDDPLARQIWDMAKFIRREYINRQVADAKEGAVWRDLNDVEQASYSPVHDGHEMEFNEQLWGGLVKKRVGSRERSERRTQRELEIERRLKTPVMLKYQDTPLSQVMDGLSALTGINIHLDPRGLSQEGVHSDTPITVNLNKEVQLKSALNLILEPLHLSYVVKDEVLKITSEQLRDGEIYAKIYNVADLVIPIPNFVPNSNIGLQGLINDAHSAMGYGNNGFGAGPAVLVSDRGKNPGAAAPSKDVVAQQFGASPTGSMPPSTVPIGAGPGGMGGGALADFDSLIDLIVSTVSTETWAENGGGEAEIRPFPTNLSLVVSQTQAVHEEIADLLEQLRRLQDLQITIEVRFIRLNDRFFERIGVDFQLNIEDRTIGTADLVPGQPYEPGRQSATVGLNPPVLPTNPFPNYTADLDIPFRQGSFAATQLVPFGGQVQGAATFGFAILSDLEAFFLIEAAQSDSRTNVLNAPKVTLFNGQQAFVADATQRPFVIGVIPVVGEFVAAQQPVIVVLNEGTMMTIQAVVSDDRRYVRLTVVPFFTQIGAVDEFTFEGSESSTSSSSSSTDDDDDGKSASESESERIRTGVTVQLPSFSFVSVVTTVSVPDGGTVLLGGIKRLSEGRNEFGVPLLSKIPYVDRLFRNVGIGRTTESLMMMVTPRIIIQEEEEERLGIATP